MTILAIMGLAAAGIALFQEDAPDDEYWRMRVLELETTVRELREENDRMTEDVARLTEDNATHTKEIERLEDLLLKCEVGFSPCWRGPRGGTRRYYFAYHITYRDERFRIEVHPDMANPIVLAMMSDRFAAVLRAHPKDWVDGAAFKQFGDRIEQARAQETAQGRYDNGCQLAVTLNGEAPGAVAAFILNSAKFYPVTRLANAASPASQLDVD